MTTVEKGSSLIDPYARHELKYRLVPSEVRRVEQLMEGILGPDKHGRDGYYRVRSLYFDSEFLSAYHHKLSGLKDRLKVRLRGYGDRGGVLFLEAKAKSGSFVRKTRWKVPEEGHGMRGDLLLSWLRRHHLEEAPAVLRRAILSGSLRPTVQVDYKRRAFVMSGPAGLRVTLDTSIMGRSSAYLRPHSGGMRPALGSDTVLEIKFFGRMPAVAQYLVWKLELLTEALSKYAMVMEAAAPLFEARRGKSLVDEGLAWPMTTLLSHPSRHSF